MILNKTYIKAHYNSAEGLYSDLNWLIQGCEVLNIFDNPETVTVIYRVNSPNY